MYRMIKVVFAVLSLLALPAYAHEDDAELEQRLDDARERLEQASREVAELSAQLGESAADFVRTFRIDGRRAMIGINMDEPHGNKDGVLVAGVTPGGPAEKAGLRSGDVIVSIDGTSLAKDGDGLPQRKLIDRLRHVDPGDEVALEYERDGKKNVATVVTEELSPSNFAFAINDAMRGMLPDLHDLPNLQEFTSRWGDMEMVGLTPGLGEYFGTDKGILIVRAPQDSQIPLKDGDVILRIDGRTPTSPGHALRILRSYQGGEHLSLDIVRKQRPMTLDVDLPTRTGEMQPSALPQRSARPARGLEIKT